MTTLLELRDIRRQFGGVSALSGVSLSLETGAVAGLIGPNGSGKTTLMNVISGVDNPTAGAVLLDNRSLTRLPANIVVQLGISRTFQHIRLIPDLTAIQNVALAVNEPRIHLLDTVLRLPSGRRTERDRRERAFAILQRLGMEKHAQTAAGDLSYGDRRRVEIARALASHPRLLLLDEPAAGMTHAERFALRDFVSELRSVGVTVLLVEHDMDLVMGVCDVIHVLDQGRLISSGKPEEVRSDPDVIAAYLGAEHA